MFGEMLSSEILSPILVFVGAVVTGLITYFTTKNQVEAEHRSTLPASWRDFNQEIKDWYAEKQAAVEERLCALEEKDRVRQDYDIYISDRIAEISRWSEIHDIRPPEILTFHQWFARRERHRPKIYEDTGDP